MAGTSAGAKKEDADKGALPSEYETEFADLFAELDIPVPEGWQPQPGDRIAGTVVEMTTADAGGYGDYPLLTLQHTPTERTAVHAFHQVLQNELHRHKVRVGDRIAIKYEGERDFKNQREGRGTVFAAYRVVVDRNRRAELEASDRPTQQTA